MSKPSQRHASHVQPAKTEAAKLASVPEPLPDDAPIVHGETARGGGFWIAMVVWTFFFGFLFLYMLFDLIYSMFRR